jgi:hypothetical protein
MDISNETGLSVLVQADIEPRNWLQAVATFTEHAREAAALAARKEHGA